MKSVYDLIGCPSQYSDYTSLKLEDLIRDNPGDLNFNTIAREILETTESCKRAVNFVVGTRLEYLREWQHGTSKDKLVDALHDLGYTAETRINPTSNGFYLELHQIT